ncbi:glycosyl hydrolase family 8 [Geminicoccus flavidas]|uniref:glycosyl hydrolase family 8 n=1 Tax=Geminicoccus flavidas TaxID=2506407 RepID=UPI001359335E|nr:glycosyl hydrolase family 8 [Geminicoccus flavidas]
MPERRSVILAMPGLLPDLPGLGPVARWLGDRQKLPPEEWDAWCGRFLDGGRVVDTGNGRVSHTEGQGYGLLLALAAEDTATFDAILAWTERHLPVRPDGLLAWRWDPARPDDPVSDPNAATDGDLLLAWALIRAGQHWNRPELSERGLVAARAVRSAGVVRHGGVQLLLPGPEGFIQPEGPVINLSYWVFPALRALMAADPHPVWAQLVTSGHRLLTSLRFGQRQLPPDWTLLAEPPRPAPGFLPVFGYNALRIPLHAAWSEPGAIDLVRPIFSIWQRAGNEPPAVIPLDPTSPFEVGVTPGIRAILALLRYLENGSAPDFPSIQNEPNYYAATLVLLARLAFDEVSRS